MPPFSRRSRSVRPARHRAGVLCAALTLRACAAFVMLAVIVALAPHVPAQSAPRAEYRGFWVDTFNTPLNNHAQIVAVVNNAKAANANAIFAQVRRRGDSWYLRTIEPLPDFTPIDPGFDPLQDLITTAHAEGIEVHAFVIIGAIWNKNPNFAPSATLGPPTNPNHVFNRHGGYNAATQTIVQSPNNWLTRTLLPDNATNGISFQGHRFGSEFWVDLGHPDAAAHTVDVLMRLVRRYDIDGLHLDRIRYPEFTATGQTPANGTNIGYNETSVRRFQQRNNIPAGSAPPATGDPAWSQWRRDQVSNLVRRVYLNAVAAKPQIKVSAALIAFGGGPTTEAAWTSAEAYWRVYQDWRAWTQEGILDIAIPMNYKRDSTQAGLYDTWNEWTKNHQYNRIGLMGLGVYLNSIEGTLRQTRRALQPSATTGNTLKGVVFYSMAVTNTAITANPHSIPAGLNTPTRPFAEFVSGLKTGRSTDGTTLYEAEGQTPVFADAATIPVLEWKASPTRGHVMGVARDAAGATLDTADVTIQNSATGETRQTATDGGGFWGGVDLAPGTYTVSASVNGAIVYTRTFTVTPGAVTRADTKATAVAQ